LSWAPGGGSYVSAALPPPPVYLDKIKIVEEEMCHIVTPRAKKIKELFLLRKKSMLNA
jgi:hypothetical protein